MNTKEQNLLHKAKKINYNKFFSCDRKIKYDTKEISDKICIEMQKRHKIKFVSYECKYCKLYHVTKKIDHPAS